jgi:NADH:ubiquinone oxidoreductase subunit D
MGRRTIKLEMNRVEGDVEIKLEVEGHTVVDAWCIGTTYRGYEQILLGRDPKDLLVICPRICGICSTSQLYAATTALEVAYQSPIAPNGIRIRNLCLMAESVMNDARHSADRQRIARLLPTVHRAAFGFRNRQRILKIGGGIDVLGRRSVAHSAPCRD